MSKIGKTLLLSAGFALLAPVAGATASPGSLRVQQTVAARVAHRAVQQQNETLRRQLDLRRVRAEREAATATSPPANAGNRQP